MSEGLSEVLAAMAVGDRQQKLVFVLDELGEIHRIQDVRWSSDNDCFFLLTTYDVE